MRTVLCGLAFLAAMLGGCMDDGDGDGDGVSVSTSTSTSASQTSTNGTTPTGIGNATLRADATNGTAPLAVDFTVEATTGALAWRLSFGTGDFANGTTFPAAANHTYTAGGDFLANLTVRFATGNATANLTIAVLAGNGSATLGPPDVTHFEYPDSLGCAGDFIGEENCLSFAAGPDGSGVDGFWEALDERYWGYQLTSTVSVNPDSDCVFTDADFAIIGEGNNGGDPCQGTVPPGTAWLYIYPYAAPAAGMTVDFTAPA